MRSSALILWLVSLIWSNVVMLSFFLSFILSFFLSFFRRERYGLILMQRWWSRFAQSRPKGTCQCDRISSMNSGSLWHPCHFFVLHSYVSVCYCDVTGRQTRLPLEMTGEGLGPKLQFSKDVLNIQHVFVNSAHTFKVSHLKLPHHWPTIYSKINCFLNRLLFRMKDVLKHAIRLYPRHPCLEQSSLSLLVMDSFHLVHQRALRYIWSHTKTVPFLEIENRTVLCKMRC